MEMKEILERMHGQKLYFCNDETLMKEQAACLEILYDFNQTRPGEGEKRTALLRQLLAEVGENVYIRAAAAGQLGPAHPYRPGRVRQLQPHPGGRYPYLYRGGHHDRPQRHHRRGHPSHPSRSAPQTGPVQSAGDHR